MKIEVTQEDINNGFPSEPGSCPIALALFRQVPHVVEVYVDYTCSVTLYIRKWYHWLGAKRVEVRFYNTHVEEFIEKFDFGYKTEPFSFEFSI